MPTAHLPCLPTRMSLTGLLLALPVWGVAASLEQVPPPLPAPSGTVVTVSSVGDLITACAHLQSNTTILVAPGTYALGGNHLEINGHITHVAIRGSSGIRSDVVIDGGGMSSGGSASAFGIQVDDAQDVTIGDLSIGNVYFSPIQLNGPSGCQRVLIHNVRVFDAGEQLIKANPVSNGSGMAIDGVNDSTVEYCLIEYTTSAPTSYTNGVDVHHGAGWTIRCNLFRNIRGPAGSLAGPTVLFWNGSSGAITERNTFVNCQRGIAYGLGQRSGFTDNAGGIIRNNMVVLHNGAQDDAPISINDSPGTAVLHNTLIGSTYFASIEYRFATTTGVTIENNLCDQPIVSRDGGSVAAGGLVGNTTAALSSWFVDDAGGDLHLVAGAAPALGAGVFPLAGCVDDHDGRPRPTSSAPDLGAHQFTPVAGSTAGSGATTSATATSGSGTTTSGTGSVGTGTTTVSTPVSAGRSGGGCGLGGSLSLLLLVGGLMMARQSRSGNRPEGHGCRDSTQEWRAR